MIEYQTMILGLPGVELDAKLNQAADLGWQILHVVQDSPHVICPAYAILGRETPEPPPRRDPGVRQGW